MAKWCGHCQGYKPEPGRYCARCRGSCYTVLFFLVVALLGAVVSDLEVFK